MSQDGQTKMGTSRRTTLVSDTEFEKSTAPSISNSISRDKKNSTDGADLESGEVKNNGQGEDGVEYPNALAMVMIVIALSLSIFLVSLDMTIVVCISSPPFALRPEFTIHHHTFGFIVNTIPGYSNSKNHRPVPRLRPCRLVWFCIFSHSRFLSINMGKGLQIFSTKDNLPHCHIHLRTREFDLRYVVSNSEV